MRIQKTIPHNMQEDWMKVCSADGGCLVNAAKYYLRQIYPSHRPEENPQLEIFDIDGVQCLVRLTKGASCTKGIGREHITSRNFYGHFDQYIRPVMGADQFTFLSM